METNIKIEEKLSQIAFNCLIFVMSQGASYLQGAAIFTALAKLMEQVDKTPNTSDDEILTTAMGIIANEISNKTPQA